MKLTFSDKNHSYYLDGKRCKSVTGIAKIPDDTFALDEWRKRMVAIGMATEPSLIERVAAHFDDRAKMTELCEEAMNVAKSHVAAGLGTAAHRIAERIDLGEDIIDTPLSLAMRAAWTSALDRAGLDVIPGFVERIVVHPDWRVCGALDRIMRRRSDGALVVVDLKTGEGAVKYPHSIACQIALYANAPLMAGPMGNPSDKGNVYTETFLEMPDGIDTSVGYIVHAAGVADGVAAEVLPVNIAAGWEVVCNIIVPTLAWRKREDVIGAAVAVAPVAAVEPATDDDFLRAQGEPSSPSPDTSSTACRSATTSTPTMIETPSPESTAPISSLSSTTTSLDRKTAILAHLATLPDAQKARIKAAWPKGVPSLKSSHEHTDAELDAIMIVLAEHTQPRQFERDMATLAAPPCIACGKPSEMDLVNTESKEESPLCEACAAKGFARSGVRDPRLPPDEGPDVADEDVAALWKLFDERSTAEKLWLSLVGNQCAKAGYPVNLGAGPTKRRWSIGVAMLHCARIGVPDNASAAASGDAGERGQAPESIDVHEQTVRALLGVVLGDEVQPAVTLGMAFAALTIDEAERLAGLARAVGTADFDFELEPDGSWRMSGPAVEAARGVA